ncbi:MAG: stage II sporulation protein R [Bacilli bacterium]|nr:stage II sporulation protein R [Bacilli bacterium]MDD4282330.1 stage II sporulation protein R [Bacilli bacterium]MDD4718334.1 stage II sporulation protein R [Bacilli bacterium]
MKKGFAIILITMIAYLSLTDSFDNRFIIPDEAIRLRVIPNSNSQYDQNIKTKVSKQLQYSMSDLLSDTHDVKEARKIISSNMNYLDSEIGNLLKREKYNLNYNINFGDNFFPEKEYKGITYKEGYYESVKVTLGEGLGDNWWCVLFPPLCLIEAEESTEVEYKFFVKEIIKKYFRI